MCKNNIKTIAIVKSGTLTKCEACNIYHLVFNNLYFEFTLKELKSFKTYLISLEMECWEQNECVNVKRKIHIPSLQKNLILVFNRAELKELIRLVTNRDQTNTLHVSDIDYTLILN